MTPKARVLFTTSKHRDEERRQWLESQRSANPAGSRIASYGFSCVFTLFLLTVFNPPHEFPYFTQQGLAR